VQLLCVDFGSTFTKAVLVDGEGTVVATASTPTTVTTDVLDGYRTIRAALDQHGAVDEVLACSSAGGGLRLAVVGYERDVTAQAGHRVGLSAGARVSHVTSGPLSGADVKALRDSRPDLVLLVLSALVAAGGGWLRYRQADRAIREGHDLPAGSTVHLLAAAVVVVIVVAGLSVVV